MMDNLTLDKLTLFLNKLNKIELFEDINSRENTRGENGKITSLDLSYLDLNFIEKDLFADLTHLIYIDLEGNNITQIENETFKNVSELSSLNLSNNKIVNFSFDCLSDPNLLQYLDLSNNCLIDFYLPTGRNFLNLRYLNLSKNDFNSLTFSDRTFYDLDNLKLLVLSFNKLYNVAFLIDVLPNLETLFLDNCHITNLTYSMFENKPNLKRIYLNSNNIKQINQELFSSNSQLSFLDLHNNNISSFNIDFEGGNRALTTLILIQNPTEIRERIDILKIKYPKRLIA